MKTKTRFLISFLFLLSNVSFSQLNNFGIKGGLNLSNAKLESEFYSNFNGMKNKTGFNVYLTYDFLNCNNIILSVEAGYSRKGFNEDNPLTDEFGNDIGTWTIYNRLNYIDVNAVAEFILRNKSVSPYFSLGPVISFYTGYNTSTTLTSFEPQIIEYEDQTLGNLKSPVLGFITGAGVEISKVIPQAIIAEVRYNFDLTNSFNNGFLNYQRNYLWQFNLGVKF